MKGLMTHGGAILVLIGVAIIAVPLFMHTATNTSLVVGLIAIVLGIIATIVLNRMIKD